MSFFEIFGLFASGITIFGVIVGIFSVYNGRMTAGRSMVSSAKLSS